MPLHWWPAVRAKANSRADWLKVSMATGTCWTGAAGTETCWTGVAGTATGWTGAAGTGTGWAGIIYTGWIGVADTEVG